MQISKLSLHIFSLVLPLLVLTSCSSKNTSDEPQPGKEAASKIKEGGKVNATPPPYFLFLADIHLNTKRTDTPYKDDTGTDLWSAAKTRLNTLVAQTPPPQFIIYTGDLTAHKYQHSGAKLSLSERQHNSKVVLTDLRSIAGSIPLFYAPGNNDGIDGDYHAFTNPNDSSVFDLVSTLDYPAPNATMISNPHPKDGYYSARPFDGLRVIALNSVILGYDHKGYPFSTDYKLMGDTMLTWLSTELADVRQQQEKAYIMMHIPPGIDAHGGGYMWDTQQNNEWQSQFLRIVDTFQQDISGILYGHTHMDELRQLADPINSSIINEIAISSPGISPNHQQNPAFKVVTYDKTSFELKDFTTYFTDRDDTVWGNDSLRFSEVYGCTGKTIKDCLIGRSVNSIATDMLNIYRAGKTDTSKTAIASAILVE
jgi:hypothetical protein